MTLELELKKNSTTREQLVNNLKRLITATSGSNYISSNNYMFTSWSNGMRIEILTRNSIDGRIVGSIYPIK